MIPPPHASRRSLKRPKSGWQPPKLPADPVAAIIEANRIRPEPWTRRWRREADIPDEVLHPALEALG